MYKVVFPLISLILTAACGTSVPAAFATKLENAGLDVDFLLAWNRPHSGDYALDEVFDWIRQITSR